MLYESPFALVQAWQDAANSQNIDRLIELSAPTIEIVGPVGPAMDINFFATGWGVPGCTSPHSVPLFVITSLLSRNMVCGVPLRQAQ